MQKAAKLRLRLSVQLPAEHNLSGDKILRNYLLATVILCLSLFCGACQKPGSQDKLTLLKFSDLAQDGIRIGIVDPDLGPAGHYALEVLKKLKLSDAASATAITDNIVTHESQVRALLDKLVRRELDAGFLYRSDVMAMAGKINVIEIPPSFAVTPEYALARIKGTLYPQAALNFIHWLTAQEQKTIWLKYGFKPLPVPVNAIAKVYATTSAAPEAAAKLTIFAAAVFYDVLSVMAKKYMSLNEVEVVCEFAGSGKLCQKIEQGAQGEYGADIFLSAAPRYVNVLVDSGRADQPQIFMRNDLVIGVVKP